MSSSSAFERLINTGIARGEPDVKSAKKSTPASGRDLDDETAMGFVQNGDREALGILFDRYSRLILKVATRILRNPTEAQDVVQEVFLYVHRKGRVFDPNKGTVASWLIQITYSRAFTRREHLNIGLQSDSARIEEFVDLADLDRSLERLTDEISAKERVHQALEELTERQRQTLRLYFFEGYSLREISTHLDESFINTRHHYYRGIEKLRTLLKDSPARTSNEGAA